MIIDYFPEKPWSCNCGCGFSDIDARLVQKLNVARDLARVPFKINSACRCQQYNASVGGVPSSAHTKGLAVDIAYSNGDVLFRMVRALMQAGFERVEIGKTGPAAGWVHVDLDHSKPWPCMWVENQQHKGGKGYETV